MQYGSRIIGLFVQSDFYNGYKIVYLEWSILKTNHHQQTTKYMTHQTMWKITTYLEIIISENDHCGG